MKILDCEPNISLEAINEVEIMLGLVFPFDYKEHILKFNGGYP